jgi:hypothetical protein
MAASDTPAETRNCLRCGRKLRSAEALARGYGDGCWRKVRTAERTADLSAWTPSQIAEAEQAIEDGAVVPSTREGVFHVVSSDGSRVHLVTRDHCSCTAGMKTLPGRPCYHRLAVLLILGPVAAGPLPVRTAIPMAAAPVTVPDDVWAALEASGALDLIPAF